MPLQREIVDSQKLENRVSVDVVPDISVTDERKLAQTLTEELQPLLDGEQITIIIDHNYSA